MANVMADQTNQVNQYNNAPPYFVNRINQNSRSDTIPCLQRWQMMNF